MSNVEKQHLFLKLGHLAVKNPKEYTETPEFAKLLAFMRGTMTNDALDTKSGVTRFEVLTTLVRLQTPDPKMFELTTTAIELGRINKPADLTQCLWVLAKFMYVSGRD